MRSLLRWFSLNARALPWRRTLDPYGIWISEIMLQQTQVTTVVPYWRRWMRALPDVRALARATPERVLKLWEGLGYYTRARNLHRAAQRLWAERGGCFPQTFDEVLGLPGIGRYTAGAICSIAFNQPTPVLDGNVTRVLARLFEIRADPRASETQTQLWHLAESLVRQAAKESTDFRSARTGRAGGNCSLLNQALMELGAVICIPRQPRCTVCPLRRHCQAYRSGRAEELPLKRPRGPVQLRTFAAFVVEREGRYLVRQRPAGTVNGLLWEFPNIEVNGQPFDPGAAARACLGSPPAEIAPLCTIRHAITSSQITILAHWVRFRQSRMVLRVKGRWLDLRALYRLAFPSAHRRIFEHLVAQCRRGAFAGQKNPRRGVTTRVGGKARSREAQPKNTLATS